MTPATIIPDLATERMHLIVSLSPRRLSALLLGPDGPQREAYAHVADLADSSVKALENVVYDCPALLGDFASVTILTSTSEFFTLPAGSEGLLDEMGAAMLPDYDAARVILRDGIVAYALPSEICNFLTRTFACARFRHSLTVCTEALTPPGFYAVCQDDTTLLWRYSANGLDYLNAPQTYSPADCAYYILAASAPSDNIYLSASSSDAEAVTSLIRQVNPGAAVLPITLPPPLVRLRDLTASPLPPLLIPNF